MHFHIITDFPDAFNSYLSSSIIGRGVKNWHIAVTFHKISTYSDRPQNRIDDTPYGWWVGTLLSVEPIDLCIQAIEETYGTMPKYHFHARGALLSQEMVEAHAAKNKQCILLCGHYEWIDERVFQLHDFQHICIGEYILSSGELAATVYIDAISRFVPGVVGNIASIQEESFSPFLDWKIEYPHYTRPRTYRELSVPEDLTSGDHKKIAKWKTLMLQENHDISDHSSPYLDNDSLDA